MIPGKTTWARHTWICTDMQTVVFLSTSLWKIRHFNSRRLWSFGVGIDWTD